MNGLNSKIFLYKYIVVVKLMPHTIYSMTQWAMLVPILKWQPQKQNSLLWNDVCESW